MFYKQNCLLYMLKICLLNILFQDLFTDLLKMYVCAPQDLFAGVILLVIFF
jgi:hypothetical protein